MKLHHSIFILLLVSALAACSPKTEAPQQAGTASAGQVATPATPAPTAPTAPTTVTSVPATGPAKAGMQKETLECDDRTIVLEATCRAEEDAMMLNCSEQSLIVVDRATGTQRSKHQYTSYPGTNGDPPLVEAKVSALSCVRSKSDQRYIVLDLFNGGNCEECEWRELYDWDGKLIGSDRDRRKPDATLNALSDDMDDPARVIAQKKLETFYRAQPNG